MFTDIRKKVWIIETVCWKSSNTFPSWSSSGGFSPSHRWWADSSLCSFAHRSNHVKGLEVLCDDLGGFGIGFWWWSLCFHWRSWSFWHCCLSLRWFWRNNFFSWWFGRLRLRLFPLIHDLEDGFNPLANMSNDLRLALESLRCPPITFYHASDLNGLPLLYILHAQVNHLVLQISISWL